MPAADTDPFFRSLGALCSRAGLFRVHPDATAPTARATLEALAGLPSWEATWAGDVDTSVVLLLASHGERLVPGDIDRRTTLLHQRAAVLGERVQGPIRALQLLVFDRAITERERDEALAGGRRGGVLSRHRVGTWVVSIPQRAVYARRFGGWPAQLAPTELEQLVRGSADEASAPAP